MKMLLSQVIFPCNQRLTTTSSISRQILLQITQPLHNTCDTATACKLTKLTDRWTSWSVTHTNAVSSKSHNLLLSHLCVFIFAKSDTSILNFTEAVLSQYYPHDNPQMFLFVCFFSLYLNCQSVAHRSQRVPQQALPGDDHTLPYVLSLI